VKYFFLIDVCVKVSSLSCLVSKTPTHWL